MTVWRAGRERLGRIGAPHLGASLFGGEHPPHPSARRVACTFPGGDLALELLTLADAPVQALAAQHPDLDLGHVEPAGMPGGEVELQPAQDALRLRGGEGLVE